MKRIGIICVLAASCFAAAAQAPQQKQNPVGAKKRGLTPAPTPAMVSEGEQKFQQNCSRCHSAPDQLSPRLSETVVMHMRVRASLSASDAAAILHYLAP